MSKTRDLGNITNVIKVDATGNVSFVSGSTTLATISTSGQMSGSLPALSSSYALSASYVTNAETLDGLDSTVFTLTSSFNTTSASLYTVSSSAYATSGSLSATSGSLSATSGSLSATSGSLSAASGSLSAASGSFNTRVTALEITGSALSSSILSVSASSYLTSGSLSSASGSFDTRISTVESKYATTGSNTFIGTQIISGSILQSGSFTSTGTLTAQTLVVQTITSSVVYSSGSNIFGNSLGNSQVFTGSVLITGSLTIAGASSATSYSGTTIYGSTVVCSPVGKFTSCIDAGSGTFSNTITTTQINLGGGASQNQLQNAANNDFILLNCGNFRIINNANTVALLTITNAGVSTFSGNVTAGGELSTTSGLISISGGGGTPPTGGVGFRTVTGRLIIYGGTSDITFQKNSNAGANMTILEGGNVGIGTATPSQKLEVAGVIRGEVVNVYGSTDPASTSPYLYSPSTGALGIGANGSERMRITSGGYVGIGTCTPNNTLQVVNSQINGGIYNTNSSGDSIGMIPFQRNNANDFFGLCRNGQMSLFASPSCSNVFSIGTQNASDVVFGTNDVIRMRITSGGNVGIGTTSPSATLHIVSPVVSAGTALKVVSDGNSNDKVFEFTGADGVASQSMYMFQSGNVGIGTCTPQRPLHVKGVFEVEDGTSSNYSLIYQSSAALAIETLNATAITLNTNGTERMRITSTGITCFACQICAPNIQVTGQIARIDTIYLGGGLNGTGNATAACYQIESAYALASNRTSVFKGPTYAGSSYYVLMYAAQDVYVYYKLALIQSSYFCGYTRFVNSQDGNNRTGISQYSLDNGGTWTTLGTTTFGPGYGYASGGVSTPSGNYTGVVVFRTALTSGSGGSLVGIDQLHFMSCGYGMYFINTLG